MWRHSSWGLLLDPVLSMGCIMVCVHELCQKGLLGYPDSITEETKNPIKCETLTEERLSSYYPASCDNFDIRVETLCSCNSTIYLNTVFMSCEKYNTHIGGACIYVNSCLSLLYFLFHRCFDGLYQWRICCYWSKCHCQHICILSSKTSLGPEWVC